MQDFIFSADFPKSEIEFVIGGQRSGKRGRGAEGKTIVAAAVERCDKEKQIGRIRVQVILEYSAYSLETFITENIQPGSNIATDSWRSYSSILKEQYHHVPTNQSKAEVDESPIRIIRNFPGGFSYSVSSSRNSLELMRYSIIVHSISKNSCHDL